MRRQLSSRSARDKMAVTSLLLPLCSARYFRLHLQPWYHQHKPGNWKSPLGGS